ncbi:MAG: hypothetical protein LC114_04605 [Bryobacterales bacterium]|nr:hypothetical protein [Bryobacterales bacterium]
MFDKTFVNQFAHQIADIVIEKLNRPVVSPRYLDYEHAAVLMCQTPDGIRGMVRSKIFPIKKFGGRNFIDIKDIEKAMDAATTWGCFGSASRQITSAPTSADVFCAQVIEAFAAVRDHESA